MSGKSDNLKERDRMEDLVVDKTIILKCALNKWVRGLNCIDVTQDRSDWSILVKNGCELPGFVQKGNLCLVGS